MEWIWTQQELDRIHLYRFMSQNKTILLTDLMEKLQFSKYRIVSMVGQLSEDVALITGVQDVITISDNNVVTFQAPLNILSVDALKQYYLSNSIRGQIVEHLINEDITTWEDLAFELDISTPKIFKDRAVIQENLLQQGIEISRDYKLVGQEENVRFFKFSMLTVYNGQRINSLPDNISKRVDLYVDRVISGEFGELRDSNLSVIRHLASIWIIRLGNGHFVSNDFANEYLRPNQDLSNRSQRLIANLMNMMGKTEAIPEDLRRNEARFIVLVLHSLGIFSDDESAQDLSDQVTVWEDKFIEAIKCGYNCMFLRDFSDEDATRLTHSWRIVLLRFMIYPYTEGNGSGMHDEMNYDYLESRYPLGFELSNSILEHYARNMEINEINIKGALLTEMVAALVVDGSVYNGLPKVNMMVDFGGNANVERLLVERFDKITMYKLNITHSVDKATDIVLTDVPKAAKNKEMIFVWQGLVSAEYITHLFEEINRIWVTKFNTWRRDSSV